MGKKKEFTHKFFEHLKEPGKHFIPFDDDYTLIMQVGKSGNKSWLYRYRSPTHDSKPRDMGLGRFPSVSYVEAKAKLKAAFNLRKQGIDPIDHAIEQERLEKMERAMALTFREAAEKYIAAKKPEWRSGKHSDQWENTLIRYAYPEIGDQAVSAIETAHIIDILEPIWIDKTTTAARLRGRIESVLDWATARGYRQGANPARWRGHLKNLLATPGKVHKVDNHPSLPYALIGSFMSELRVQEGLAAKALELLILTACRTTEVLDARWEEIDLDEALWVIPAHRIKAGKEHAVPLSVAATSILKEMLKLKGEDQPWVFPGRHRKSMSNGSILALLKRMNWNIKGKPPAKASTDSTSKPHQKKQIDEPDRITAHGFRASFRTWCSEQTSYSHDVAEHALAHGIKDKTVKAYVRTTQFEQRKRLMADWAAYCDIVQPAKRGNVVPMRG